MILCKRITFNFHAPKHYFGANEMAQQVKALMHKLELKTQKYLRLVTTATTETTHEPFVRHLLMHEHSFSLHSRSRAQFPEAVHDTNMRSTTAN